MKAEIETVEIKGFRGEYSKGILVVLNMTNKEALGLIEKLAQCMNDTIFEGAHCNLDEASVETHFRDESKNSCINGKGNIKFIVSK
jgi:hypothetical protein